MIQAIADFRAVKEAAIETAEIHPGTFAIRYTQMAYDGIRDGGVEYAFALVCEAMIEDRFLAAPQESAPEAGEIKVGSKIRIGRSHELQTVVAVEGVKIHYATRVWVGNRAHGYYHKSTAMTLRSNITEVVN